MTLNFLYSRRFARGVTSAIRQAPDPHTPPLFALIIIFKGMLGVPQLIPENLKQISQLYQNTEFSRTIFCSPRPTELCMQTLHLLHADPIEL